MSTHLLPSVLLAPLSVWPDSERTQIVKHQTLYVNPAKYIPPLVPVCTTVPILP
jgi:hypothetical protein